MKRVALCVSALSFFVLTAIIAGCGGGPGLKVSLSTGSAVAIDQGQQLTINATVTSDATNSGVAWTCTGAACTTLTTSTTSATFNASGVAGTATITASSVKQPTVSTSIVVTVSAPPSTTTTQTQLTAAPATAGQSYSFSLTASGGAGSLTWTATGLPSDGLSLNSSTGAITGTPTSKGTVTFTYTVKDSSAAGPLSSTSGSLAITVANPAAPAITTTQPQVTAATAASAYSFKFQASGTGTLTWSVTGLPADGLTFNTSNNTVSGTPTSPQTVAITLTVSDTYGQSSAATPFNITVNPAPLSITTTSLPQGTIGTGYSSTNVAITGGTAPFTWSVSSGALPAGLLLNTSTGAITGTPTSAAVTSAPTIKVADSSTPQMTASKSFTVAITLSVTTASLPNAAIGTAYTATLAAEGGQPSYSWSVTNGSLPAGLSLNASTGAITGTPANNATSANITVKVQDSATAQQSATQAFSIFIPLTLESSSLPNGAIGSTYSQSVAVGGGTTPYTWSVTSGSLPAGLSLNASTGAITGTPANNTTSSTFTVKVTDSSGTPQNVSSSFTITIPLKIETSSLPSGAPNVAYSQNVSVGGGITPYTWSITSGSLPPPLVINASTGAITGTPSPTDNGNYSFTVQVVDSTLPSPQTTTQNLAINISALVISSSSLSNGTIGTAYNNTPVTASGGTGPYTYAVASGSLPSGLSLNTSNGAITGTPSASAIDQSFSIKVTDSSVPAQTATSSTLSMIVNFVVTTTSPLSSGAVGVAYNQTINAEGGQPPYTFAVDGGGNPLPAGLSLSSSGVLSGSPTTAATTSNIIVDAADSATTPQTAQPVYSITISTPCGSGSESLLNGQYAFLLTGFDNEGTPEPALVGGVLTLNGSGSITAGTVDMNLSTTGGAQTNSVTSGTYSIGSDHRGCMAISTSAGTQNYRFSVGNITSGVASTGHMIDFDATGPFTSGELRKQDTTAFSTSKVTGKYAFGFSAPENINSCNNSICGGKFGAVGVFDFSSGSITGGQVDFNENGSIDNSYTSFPATAATIGSGTYTIGANGRGTLSFIPPGSTSNVNTIIYVVSATDVLIMSSDDQTQTNIFAGEMLQQSGTFSTSSLSGTYILYNSSLNGSSGTNVSLIRLSASSGNLTATIAQNNAGTTTSQTGSGTYTVNSSGRSLWTLAGSNHNPVVYLVNANEGFELNANGGVEAGVLMSQTGGPFSASTANGIYAFGTVDPANSAVSDSSGAAAFDGVSAITGASDDNSGGFLTVGQTINQSYTIDSTGLGLSPSGCTINSTSTNCKTIFYVISPTKAAIIDPTSTNPGVQIGDK
ncbi:MAG TPA: putative Ig domain-containing protein [Candidatus Dormibacteraeota bacterium]|nr:putative Ig domain-containing protein [Candidatus Dormibacteraeota bacterium]